MKRVTGLGGIFFKARDQRGLLDWYGKHLGIAAESWGTAFTWTDREDPAQTGYTVWSPFAHDTDYFDPSPQSFMVNYRVHDLEALVAALREEGVQLVGEIQHEANGKFAWGVDPEGNKFELWEPVDSRKDPYLPK